MPKPFMNDNILFFFLSLDINLLDKAGSDILWFWYDGLFKPSMDLQQIHKEELD
jgi:hypothetical protein